MALHRAAYLLYTHRFPLEGQGVLVVGPNRLFLGYIEQVLPSLGEAGVELAVLADLIDDVRVQGRDTGLTARIKGDLRMVARAAPGGARPRARRCARTSSSATASPACASPPRRAPRIVTEARRRYRKHNAGRRFVERELFDALARSGREELAAATVRERVRATPEVREALERMWPVLTPAQLLHDLFGSRGAAAQRGRRPR